MTLSPCACSRGRMLEWEGGTVFLSSLLRLYTTHTALDWLLDECAPLFDSALLMMQVSAKGVSAMALRCEVCNVSFLLFCMFVHPSKMP